MPRIHVTGHRNPDTDSIASAIAYAELKCALDPDTEYVPARLGRPNPQTEWALERTDAPVPDFLPHIHLRVSDVMRDTFPVAHDDDAVRTVGQLMTREGLDLLPVVGADGELAGVLTERALARRYVRESREASHLEAPTSVAAMVDGLDGVLLSGDPEMRVAGRVWVLAMDLESMLSDVSEGDVVVVGDRPDAQRRAIEAGVGVVVISNSRDPSPELLTHAREHGTPVIRSPLDSYVAGRMITLSSPCRALLEREPLTVRADHLVTDIAEDIKDVSYRAAVVVDGAHRPIGLVTRADLVSPQRRRVILVDHAEQAQSVPGIEEAEIVEILDHHHIGSIETKLPIIATFDPVGSTATLVAERFHAAGIVPERSTAGMLLAAVLSDTVILNSPTTTRRDRVVMERLGEMLDLDPLAFGREMFAIGSDVSGVSADDIVRRDAKPYDIAAGQTICIAQIETVGETLEDRTAELIEAIERLRVREGHRAAALMVTDVLAHATRLLVAGDVAFVERGLGLPAEGGVFELPGVMSRKKQVAPRLLAA